MTTIGPYQVQRELARGGMGVVYLARGPAGEEVAIKLLLDDGLLDVELQRRFQREAEALLALDHPGILRARSFGLEGGKPYLVMDLLSGPTLEAYVRERGPLPSAQVIALGRAMGAALAHAHAQGIVHRDLKPANVILRGDAPVLVDFGLVRLLRVDVSQLTVSGAILGSPAYMAPEQANGEATVGPPADVYGLGATLYACLTGRPPYEGLGVIAVLEQVLTASPARPSQLRPGVDPGLEELILRCMERDPADRPLSAEVLVAELDALAAGLGEGTRARSRAWLVGLALVALLVAVGGSVWLLRGSTTAPKDTQPQGRQITPASAVEQLIDSARTLHGAGQSHEALKKLDQALELDGDRVDVHLARAVVNDGLGRSADAFADCERAVELDPGNPACLLRRGNVEFRRGRFEEALADSAAALDLEPGFVEAYLLQGEVLWTVGRLEEALQAADRAVALAPDRPLAQFGRGRLLGILNRNEEALVALAAALELDPQLVEAHVARGTALRELNRPEEALRAISRALELDPDLQTERKQRGVLLLELGRPGEALVDFERGLERDAQDPDLHGNRGAALDSLGRIEQAELALDRALDLAPRSVDWLLLRGSVRFRQGNQLGALEDFESAQRLAPTSSAVLEHLGLALARLGRTEAALARWGEALALPSLTGGQRAKVLVSRGLVLGQRGEFLAALASFEEALALEPTNVGAAFGRANALVRLGRVKDALLGYEQALALQPGRAEIYFERGRARTYSGNLEHALADFDRALASASSLNPEVLAELRTLRAATARAEELVRAASRDVQGGRPEAALPKLNEALRELPKVARIYARRALVLASLGQLQGALADYDRALGHVADDAELYLRRAQLRARLGLAREAIADYDAALALSPAAKLAAQARHERARLLERGE